MKRCSMVLVCVLAGVLAGQAAAQNRPLLDLTAAPSAPAPGAGSGTLALADALGAEAAGLDKIGTSEARVRAELRRLARELLASGEKTGQAGSARIVMGRTLVHAMVELDRLVATPREEPVLLSVAGDLAAARKALEAGNADVDLVLRDGLAMLSRLAGPAAGVGGWVDVEAAASGPLGARIDAWAGLPGVTREAVAAIRQIESLGADAQAWPAYAAAAERMRGLIAEGARAIEAPPEWVQEASRRILGEQFSQGVVGLSRPEERAAALDTLTRLCAFATVIARAEALDDNAPGRKVRMAVAQALSVPAAQADSRTVESVSALLVLAAARTQWPEEKTLIRQLRPPLRIFVAAARQTEQQVMAALPEVLRRPEAMTDPGVLSAITSHRRAIEDVEGLIAVNAAFVAAGSGEPVADKPWQNAVARVLKLSQDLAKAEQKEPAMASLRVLFATVDRSWRFPGEEDLRRAAKEGAGIPVKERTAPWAKLTGGREAALAAEITDRRAGWISDWEKNFPGGSDGQRLEALRGLVATMHDAAPVVSLGREYASVQSWPGWELSPATLALFSAGLEEQLAEATRLILVGETVKAAEIVATVRKECAAVLLAGRLAREAQRRGISGERGAAAALRELTAGGPVRGRSWLGRETEWLDDVCRYGEEVAALRKLGAKDKGDALQRFVNLRAGEVMERMEQARPAE